jgi:hypothetical protein
MVRSEKKVAVLVKHLEPTRINGMIRQARIYTGKNPSSLLGGIVKTPGMGM